MSKDDMGKFEVQEMKKIRPMKRNCIDQLIKQSVMGKNKIITDKLKDKIMNNIWTLSETEDERDDRKTDE